MSLQILSVGKSELGRTLTWGVQALILIPSAFGFAAICVVEPIVSTSSKILRTMAASVSLTNRMTAYRHLTAIVKFLSISVLGRTPPFVLDETLPGRFVRPNPARYQVEVRD